jgi:hypothetical protein
MILIKVCSVHDIRVMEDNFLLHLTKRPIISVEDIPWEAIVCDSPGNEF